jgi:hypothetical protein
LRASWNVSKPTPKTIPQHEPYYFEPATDEKDGQWISASAIFSYLKEEVGVSLLKPISLPVFGRKLTNLPGLQKRVTKYNTEYLVKRRKR